MNLKEKISIRKLHQPDTDKYKLVLWITWRLIPLSGFWFNSISRRKSRFLDKYLALQELREEVCLNCKIDNCRPLHDGDCPIENSCELYQARLRREGRKV